MNKPSRHTRAQRKGVKTDKTPLINRAGKVDPAALFRAAKAAEKPPAPINPAPDPEAGAGAEAEPDDDLLIPQAPPPAAVPPSLQKIAFTLQHDLVKRLDRYLTDRITFMSRSKLQALIEGGGVLVNGRIAKSSTVLRIHDHIEVSVPPPPSEDFEPQDIPLDVLFEDEHMIVLNKQANIIVHPARTHTRGTLINALAFHFRNRSPLGGALSGVGKEFARPGVVHRLDRHTSGVIIFAKSDHAHWQLGKQFMDRTVDKRYVAIAHGEVTPAADVIDLPIGPHPSRQKGYREKHVVRHDHLGRPAVTIYRVLGTYGEEPKQEGRRQRLPGAPRDSQTCSLVEVELKTGRTHQIRVHFSHQGFPLVGDDMYGGRALKLADGTLFERQALHAALLTIRHPITRAQMTFTAPLPPDMQGLLKHLRTLIHREPAPAPGTTLTVQDLLGPLSSRSPDAPGKA